MGDEKPNQKEAGSAFEPLSKSKNSFAWSPVRQRGTGRINIYEYHNTYIIKYIYIYFRSQYAKEIYIHIHPTHGWWYHLIHKAWIQQHWKLCSHSSAQLLMSTFFGPSKRHLPFTKICKCPSGVTKTPTRSPGKLWGAKSQQADLHYRIKILDLLKVVGKSSEHIPPNGGFYSDESHGRIRKNSLQTNKRNRWHTSKKVQQELINQDPCWFAICCNSNVWIPRNKNKYTPKV